MTRIGIVSDTHMPDRLRRLPAAIFDVLAGVDLLLHAGDVGELSVLDQLSAIAPVIAVHGNDDTEEAQHALPYLQTLTIAGQRLVLMHSHYPDLAEERASRTNPWHPKWERFATIAQQHGANLFVFGHWHIPIHAQYGGVTLINPGAIASGNHWLRQTCQTVAVLTLESNQPAALTHYDLASGAVHTPRFDPAGFMETYQHYSAPITDETLYALQNWIVQELDAREAVIAALRPLCFACWEGQRAPITLEEFAQNLREQPALPEQARTRLEQHPHFAPYFC